jgi:hypothetical protein
MANDFKYIIQTELKLSPGTLSSLLTEIKGIDNQIQAQLQRNGIGISVQAKLAPNSMRVLQQQLGNIRATIPVNLRVSEASYRIIEGRLKELRRLAEIPIRVATESTQAQPIPTRRVVQNINKNNLPRVGSTPIDNELVQRAKIARIEERESMTKVRNWKLQQQQNQTLQDSVRIQSRSTDELERYYELLNRKNMLEGRLKSLDRGTLEGNRATTRALERIKQVRQEMAVLKSEMASFNVDSFLKKMNGSQGENKGYLDWLHSRSRGGGPETVADLVRKERQRIEKEMTGKSSRLNDGKTRYDTRMRAGSLEDRASSLEDILKDTNRSASDKRRAIELLDRTYKNLAQTLGTTLTRSFQVMGRDADGNIQVVRTLSREYSRYGEVVERGARGTDKMLGNMARSALIYTGLAMAINGVVTSLQLAITTMSEFEVQFLKLQNVTTDSPLPNYRNRGFNDEQMGKDLFGMGRKYGLNPLNDIMPTYQEVVRRKELAGNPQDAMDFTKLAIRSGFVAKGGNVTSQDMLRLSEDMISIYQVYFDTWNKDGVRALDVMADHVDFLAVLNGAGADIDKTLDALSGLAPLAKEKGIDLRKLASIVGEVSHTMNDASGSELETAMRTFINNITKLDGAPGSVKARELLGFNIMESKTGNGMMSIDEIIDATIQGINGDGKGRLDEIARYLASSSGGAGSARQGQILNIMKSLEDGVSKYNEINQTSYRGEAERLAIKNAQTLRGEYNKLVNEIQLLVVNLGNAGLLDALKGITATMTNMLTPINNLMVVFNKFGEKIEENFGVNLTKYVASFIALAGAIKLSSLAYGRLAKDGLIKGNIDKFGRSIRRSPSEAQRGTGSHSVGSFAGAVVGELVGAVLFGGIMKAVRRRGRTGFGRTGANVGSNVVSRLMTGFGNLLKTVGRLVLVFGRLSAIGAVVGGAIWGISALMKVADKAKNDSMDRLNKQFETKESKETFLNDVNRFAEVQKQYGPMASKETTSEYFALRSKMRDYGLTPNTRWGRVMPNEYSYYRKDFNGERQKGVVNLNDPKTIDEMVKHKQANQQGLSTVAYEYENARTIANLSDYTMIQMEINELTDRHNKLSEYGQRVSLFNNLKFSGATDSVSFLVAEIEALKPVIDESNASFEKLMARREELVGQDTKARLLVERQAEQLSKAIGANKSADMASVKEIDIAFAKAKESGDIEGFIKNYKGEERNDYESSYADAKFEQYKLEEAQKGLTEEIDKTILSNIEQINTFKSLSQQLLVASSGVQLLSGALKGIRSDVSHAQSLVSLATNDEDKVQRTVDLMGVMAQEASIYEAQLGAVQRKIEEIKSANPEQNFSIDALYNPIGGLTDQQMAVKEMTEMSYELRGNFDNSTVALKEQRDAITDLIMQTDKYKSAWDSVNDRIETVRSLGKQLEDVFSTSKARDMLMPMRKSILGDGSFNENEYKADNAIAGRDTLLGIAEEAQKAINTFGNDNEKLKQALKEIGASSADKFKITVVDPFKSVINNDMKSAIELQFEASTKLNEGMANFQKYIDGLLEKLGLNSSGQSTKSIYDEIWSKLSSGDKEFLDKESPESRQKFLDKKLEEMATKNIESKYGPSYNMPQDTIKQLIKQEIDRLKGVAPSTPTTNSGSYTGQYADIINEASSKFGVDPFLIASIIKQESGFNPKATSKAGAQGLMQLMPGTASGLGVTDSYDPRQNIMGGTEYIAKQLAKFGDTTKALVAYNAGPGNVDNVLNSGDGSWKEPKNYVQKVAEHYKQLTGQQVDAETYNATADKIVKAIEDSSDAYLEAIKTKRDSLMGALILQVVSLMNTNIQGAMRGQQRDSNFYGQVLGGSRVSALNGRFTAINDARGSAYEQRKRVLSQVDSLVGLRGEKQGELANTTDTEMKKVIQDEIKTINELITSLKSNFKALNKLEETLKKQASLDPKWNAGEANKEITKGIDWLSKLQEQGNTGSSRWYQVLADIQQMFGEYLTLEKKVALSQDVFDKTGFGYENLSKLKQMKWQDDVNVLFYQMNAINAEMSKFAHGTNKWHVILEDAVAVQEKLIELENRKTEMAKRYFELTGKGQHAYVNARAYQQSRDYSQGETNKDAMIQKYSVAGGAFDANEQLVTLQIISELHDKQIQVMNEYRSAVVGAYKAGAISMDEYIQRLYNLRDVQNEAKEQAIGMYDSISSAFQGSFSDALNSAFQGNFEAPLDFMQNIKSSLSNVVSSQFSNLVMNNSGLKTVMDDLIKSMTQAMTTGDVNESLNAFNSNNFGAQIDGALSPFLPLIEQIASSTDGIFGVLKDQVFNSPSGFKIDDYLYEMTKGKTHEDLVGWLPRTGQVNEAGSPIGGWDNTDVSVPTLTAPTGVPTTVTKPVDAITSTGLPMYNNQPQAVRNPVKELLGALVSIKDNYSLGKNIAEGGNTLAHGSANDIRAILNQIAPDVADEIGDGVTGKSLEDLKSYLANEDLSKYDMTQSLDGMSQGVQSKLEGVIGGVGNVVNAINALRSGSSTATDNKPVSNSQSNSQSPSGSKIYSDVSGALNLAKMKKNSTAWHTSSTAQKVVLSAQNAQLGASMGWTKKDGVWYKPDGNKAYHTGGIAGMMNFSNGNKLQPNEIQAVLQKEETIFQKGQLGSFMEGLFGGGSASSGGGEIKIDININVNGQVDEDRLNATVGEAVLQAVAEMKKQNRLSNLSFKGVSY